MNPGGWRSIRAMLRAVARSDEREPVDVEAATARFATDLRPDERVLWAGFPDPGRRFTRADLFFVPFSIVWAGFAFFWEVSVITQLSSGDRPTSIVFPLFGIPFVVIGVYILVGRFAYKAYRKRRTAYALTDRRALVLYEGSRRSIESVTITDGSTWTYDLRPDGSGDIRFGPLPKGTVPNAGLDMLGNGTSPVAFYDLADARAAVDVLNRNRDDRPA